MNLGTIIGLVLGMALIGFAYYLGASNAGVPNISLWDTSMITDMSYLFESSNFNENINDWNVSNVENMSFMFYDIMEV